MKIKIDTVPVVIFLVHQKDKTYKRMHLVKLRTFSTNRIAQFFIMHKQLEISTHPLEEGALGAHLS